MRKIKIRLFNLFGIKGSWSWAKAQMIKGKVVKCKHWSGALKLKIDNSENQRLMNCFWNENKQPPHGNLWESSNHFLNKENHLDYEIVEGW